MLQKGAARLMTIQEVLIFCNDRSKKDKYFVAPITIIKQFEQEKITYYLDNNGNITVLGKIFKIERGG